jgi:hypothetical protein
MSAKQYPNLRARVVRACAVVGVTAAAILAVTGGPASAASDEGPPMKLKTVLGGGFAANTGFDAGSTVNGEPLRQWWNRPHDWNNQWIPKYIEGGKYFTFRNRWSNQCIDVAGYGVGAEVEQQPCDGTRSQQWSLQGMNGHLKIVNRAATEGQGSERLLTVFDSDVPGSILVLWSNYGGADQQWDWATP